METENPAPASLFGHESGCRASELKTYTLPRNRAVTLSTLIVPHIVMKLGDLRNENLPNRPNIHKREYMRGVANERVKWVPP